VKGETYDGAAIVLTDDDTVATALDDLRTGRTFTIDDRIVELVEDVEFGHKFALEAIDSGERVTKYGEVIGEATQPIEPGEWVHTHNLRSLRAQPDAEGES